MRQYRRTLIVFISIAFIGIAGTVPAEETGTFVPAGTSPVSSPRLDSLLPFNDEITRGRLPNGVEYFLQNHPHPQETVTIRLIVDAGSVLEQEDQRGLAHFVEHMAFNGTADYEENELVAYLERLGIQFGPDVNAYTSFDETVYRLDIPAQETETLETGFHVMSQWAGEIAFANDAIERERGVIVEEWRRGQNASQRVLRQHLPVLLAESRYAERLPIGEMEVVRNAPREEFLDFYRRWYRPDNMAVVVAGDLPVERMERLVRRHFGNLQKPDKPLHRPYYNVPIQDGLRASIATDTELQRSTVALYGLQPPQPFETEDDYRRSLIRSLFASVLNERIRNIVRDPDAPIVQGGVGWNRFLRNTEIAVATAVVRGDHVEEALSLLVTELYRVKRHGFLSEEVDRARTRLLQSIDEALVNRDSRKSATLADELVRYWTEGEAVPGIEEEHRLYQKFLPAVTPAEVSAVIDDFLDLDGSVILAGLRITEDGTLPDGRSLPTEEELMDVLQRVEGTRLNPWSEAEVAENLITDPPQPGYIVSETTHDAVGTTELLLSNGMRVFLKPTDFKEDDILFSAYSPGGLALVEDDHVAAAQLAPALIEASGIGDIDAATLEKFLTGRSVDISTSISRVSETISGRSRTDDLPLLMQLVYLTFTKPRFDEVQLENLRRRTIQQIEGTLSSPFGKFGNRLEEIFAAENPRLRSPNTEEVQSVELAEIESVFRDRFSRPEDFSLFFVGSFSLAEIRPLIVNYLSSIPSGHDGSSEQIPDSAPLPPSGIIDDVVYAGSEPVGQTVILIHGPYEWSQEQNHRFNSLIDLLDIRLREAIREEAGGSYSVGASGWRWRLPAQWSFAQLYYGMDPQRSEELSEIAYAVVDEIRSEPPSEDYIQRIAAQQREQYRTSVRNNGYWLSNLQFAVQHGRELADILAYPQLIESLTPEHISDTAARFLDPQRRIQLMLLPQEQ